MSDQKPIIKKGNVVCSSAQSCDVCSQFNKCGWCTIDSKCYDGNFINPKAGPCTESLNEYQWSQCSGI